MVAATSSGRARPAERARVGVGEDAELRVLAEPVGHRGGDQAGSDGVEPDAGADPLLLHALAARPVGQRRLGRGVDVHRLGPRRRPRAAASSSWRQAVVTSEAQPGWAVIEFEASSTTAAPPGCRELRPQPADQRRRCRSSSPTRPAPGRPRSARRHPRTAPARAPRRSARGRRPPPRSRPSAVDRSATTSAPRRSTVTTRWPSSRSIRVVAAPIPEAAPVTTYVRCC